MRPPRGSWYIACDLQALRHGPLQSDPDSIDYDFFRFCWLLVASSDFHAKSRLFCRIDLDDFDLYTAY